VSQNQFDSIDLSDNAILILEGFPQLSRLRSLYLNNNRIIRVGRNLEGEPPRPYDPHQTSAPAVSPGW